MADLPLCAVWHGTNFVCLDGSQAEKTLFEGRTHITVQTGQCIYCTDLPEWLTFHSSQKTFHSNKIVLILQADYNKMYDLMKRGWHNDPYSNL